MTKINNKKALLGALNLLIAGSELQGQSAFKSDLVSSAAEVNPIHTTKNLNLVSLKTIESSWLKIPPTCKARSFNANPSTLAHQEISQQVLNIYSSYNV